MVVSHESELAASADRVYAWHARPGAFERLLPPWEEVRLLGSHPGLVPDARAEFEFRIGWWRARWIARHLEIDPGRGFVDRQERGPFARWEHRHRFEPIGPDRTRMVDRIEFDLPGGPLGELVEPIVRRRLRRALRYRHAVTAGDLDLEGRLGSAARGTVAISGASGLIGRTLVPLLEVTGYRVLRLVRRPAGPGEIEWNPAAGRLDPEALAGVDAVVHLAGESIADRRWTPAVRARIRDSRVRGTTTLVNAMLVAPTRPRVLISASAVGVYGERGDTILEENASPGAGFLAEVGRAWEGAALRAEAGGIRVALPRFGIVLSPRGGALARMLLPFRLGLGGRLDSGDQWMSWIGIDDVAGALIHVLATGSLAGPVNVTAPEPITNAAFTATLGRVLRRPAVVPVPGALLRLVLGDLADEGLLASARVVPTRLTATGYRFRHPTLESALRHVLGRTRHS